MVFLYLVFNIYGKNGKKKGQESPHDRVIDEQIITLAQAKLEEHFALMIGRGVTLRAGEKESASRHLETLLKNFKEQGVTIIQAIQQINGRFANIGPRLGQVFRELTIQPIPDSIDTQAVEKIRDLEQQFDANFNTREMLDLAHNILWSVYYHLTNKK